jgi:putative radical SAM enzyme (TIGR03279 family)
MVKITDVFASSKAKLAGVEAGDILLSINENEINDVLDYRFYLAERSVTLKLRRGDKDVSVTIKKGEYDDIGLDFETPLMDEKQTCKNKCIFCFIDQNPDGMRAPIYFKDDDSRLSFIHGNYVTLTNMTERDVARIIKMRMSPINISVHTTNPDLRVRMMKNKHSGEVLKYLQSFKDAGLKMCGQIVLCKGVNDGDELLRTMRDLASYYPSMSSVAIVPAGLTKFRDKLFPLTDFSADEAGRVIDAVDAFASELKDKIGVRVFYCADELYLKAGREVPSEEYYEDYSQLENGVGMIRSLYEEAHRAIEDAEAPSAPRHVSIATGVAAYPTILRIARELTEKCGNLQITVYKIINNFFGESITVSGLLTGRDLYESLKDKELYDELLLPSNMFREAEDDFLCGMKRSELSERLGVPVIKTGYDGYELVDSLLGIQY